MPPSSERQPLILNFIETLENRARKYNHFSTLSACVSMPVAEGNNLWGPSPSYDD
jgi:hypothetical protein